MIYFASDIHLREGHLTTEREFVAWLLRVSEDAEAIILGGDIFDFWFEYKRVIPMGFSRTLGTLSSLTDRGVRVIFIAGNHDMWLGDYLSRECGLEIYTKPHIFEFGDRRVHIAHGDNLNVRKDWKLQLINKIFRSKITFKLFSSLIHPDLALKFGQWWSNSSRKKHPVVVDVERTDGVGVEALVDYAQSVQNVTPCDYYIYGHLHYPKVVEREGYKVLFTNDWSESPHFIKIDNEGVITLEKV
ncbi:MAG: UDP-2,3-diacylglucosamine diphosphatase [Rikenellaceae bacterium]